MNTSNQPETEALPQELLEHLPIFESFLDIIGFKRIDGSIYGLLVLAEHPLSPDEIAKKLKLSQSAVSQGLKNLNSFGALLTQECRERRCKLHSAKEDSLSIVASILRKRELGHIEDFRRVAKKILNESEMGKESARNRKLESIILTCDMAESVINFVIMMAGLQENDKYGHIAKKLPQVLELLTSTSGPITNFTTNIASKIKTGITHISGEHK